MRYVAKLTSPIGRRQRAEVSLSVDRTQPLADPHPAGSLVCFLVDRREGVRNAYGNGRRDAR